MTTDLLPPLGDASDLRSAEEFGSNGHRHLAGIADIVVHVDGSDEDEPRLAWAESIAVAADAHVTAFMTNEVPISPLLLHPGGEFVLAEIWKQARKTGDQVEVQLTTRMTLLEPLNSLRRSDGRMVDLCTLAARQARACDLFVASRPYGAERNWPALVETVLFEGTAPILLVPPGNREPANVPRTVLLGWQDTRECSRAIMASMPFLRAAENVHLVAVAEDGSEEEYRRDPMADTGRYLARHGVRLELRRVPHWAHYGEGLLTEAKALDADMVVAGAYGHSRIRERILGGATLDLLTQAEIPILMCH